MSYYPQTIKKVKAISANFCQLMRARQSIFLRESESTRPRRRPNTICSMHTPPMHAQGTIPFERIEFFKLAQ
jgi:hypothetical protein